MSSCGELHSKNQMRVISKKYIACKCGNEKGICQVHCTIYDHKGEKETKLISEEIICENCKSDFSAHLKMAGSIENYLQSSTSSHQAVCLVLEKDFIEQFISMYYLG